MIQLEDLTKEFDVASGPNSMVVATDRLNLHIPAGEVFSGVLFMVVFYACVGIALKPAAGAETP
jgi:hypothetical protein